MVQAKEISTASVVPCSSATSGRGLEPVVRERDDEPHLRLRNFGLQRGGRWLFRNLDLSIARGKFVAIVGPSGVGKSSLLSCLAGMVASSEGEVEYRCLGNCCHRPFDFQKRIGIIFQSYMLTPNNTVMSNVLCGRLGRYLKQTILNDLREKMVFLGGPRQVGKTTLALDLLPGGDESHPAYLTWDSPEVRTMLLKGGLPAGEDLIVLDEIHKFKGWRNLVKGFYDTNKSRRRFLVTGSARLDHYRRGGDSLLGRYHYHRLHPFSLHEIDPACGRNELDHLLRFGGFPEPFLKGNARHWRRWQRERQSRVIQEDLINLEQVKEVSQLDLLASLLPERVGSVLSVNNLRQDLSVAFETADRWIRIFENLYFCFRIAPYGLPRLRAVKKEQKLYLWDWSACPSPPARFENLVASHLLKYCHRHEDSEGETMELRFLRDSAGRELDFVVLREKRPLFAVECKSGEQRLSRNISYFASRTPIPLFYQVHLGLTDQEYPACKARILPFAKLAQTLKL